MSVGKVGAEPGGVRGDAEVKKDEVCNSRRPLLY